MRNLRRASQDVWVRVLRKLLSQSKRIWLQQNPVSKTEEGAKTRINIYMMSMPLFGLVTSIIESME